nr:hypothetical protein [Eubacterium sp.]
MANTNAVKDPKNGVISCWVCTGMMIFMNILRLVMLRMENKVWDWIFIILIAIWVILSVVETTKYMIRKKKNNSVGSK